MAKVAVVTGANQGLGRAVVAGLCRQLGPEDIVYLTGGNAERVKSAVTSLEADGLRAIPHLLDVRSSDSVASFAVLLRERHGDVDIVFSNAAARLMPNALKPSRYAGSSTRTALGLPASSVRSSRCCVGAAECSSWRATSDRSEISRHTCTNASIRHLCRWTTSTERWKPTWRPWNPAATRRKGGRSGSTSPPRSTKSPR
jgi:NAD(P)-dependent dehydrogenase (short-subunit alcohol dehydrogenase family)